MLKFLRLGDLSGLQPGFAAGTMIGIGIGIGIGIDGAQPLADTLRRR